MLPAVQIKQHTKYAVWSHIFSCFLVMLAASLIPNLISNVATEQLFSGVNLSDPNFDVFAFVSEKSGKIAIAQLISLAALLINLPFEYLLIRYYFVLSGTPAGAKCSLRVFFSGLENTKGFLKGAVIVFLLNTFSFFGLIVGYFPVFLTFCMAPFYLAVDSKISIGKAFSQSRKLMKGHRLEVFLIIIEFIALELIALFLSFFGAGLFSTLLSSVAQSLMYTCLAVIFVFLNREQSEEKKDT